MILQDQLNIRKKTHLIFDLDETLLELILPWDLWEKDIEDELRKIDGDILKDYQSGKVNLSQLENLYVKKYPKTLKLLIRNALKFEAENLKDIRVNQPLINFIKSTQGYKMSIWSSNSRPIVKKVLQKVGILAKFEKLITREDVKFLKPEADGFNKIWDDKIPKSQYLFIGNSEADQEAAHKAQIDFFKISF